MPDLIAGYLDRLKLKNFSENSLRAYAQDLRQAARAIGGPLEAATPEQLGAFLDGLARAGLKGTSIRRKQASIRGFFAHLMKGRAIALDPTGNFEPPRLEKKLPVYLKDGQIATLMAALNGETPDRTRERAIVLLLYFTGMRAGELVALDLDHLDLEDREIRVYGKGRKERILPMGDRLIDALRAYLAIRPGPARGPLFLTTRKPYVRLGYDGVDAIVKGAFARAGLAGRKFSSHKLRHTFATRLINRKVDISKISKLMGHAKLDTTTIYAHTELNAELRHDLDAAL